MSEIKKLQEIMKALRDPDTGCPWDIEQSFQTIAPYTVEEAYEVADAIERNNMPDLMDELGDLLFQVIFHAQMADENNEFDFSDVVQSLNDKLVRRHPHVFSDASIANKQQLYEAWEKHKREERANIETSAAKSELDGIANSLPALRWSEKLQKRAAHTGFDWDDVKPVFAKLDEEVAELKDEINNSGTELRIEEEMGDVLFSCVNLSRHLGVNPEQALRNANLRFIQRFRGMEKFLHEENRSFADCTLDELEQYWQKSKQQLSANERE